ncbi:MAG TPA: hypothetical protein VNF04_11975 [Stellaceae bacterium]|nr:hypothetical protein [Stellaceae bacterium]
MAHTQVQRARGTSAQNAAYTGPAGEITVNTDDWSLRVHDGVALGGWPLRAIGANYAHQTPTSGATLTAAAHLGAYILEPVATLASLTIVMPSAPNDGDVFEVATTQTITALTINPAAGQSVMGGGPLTLAADGGAAWRYRAANTTWYRRY